MGLSSLLARVKPYIAYAIIAAWLGSLAWAFTYGGKVAIDAQTAQQTRADASEQRITKAVTDAAAAAIAALKVKQTTVYQKAVETIRENTVYTSCLQTEDMKKLIQESRRYEP